MGNGIWIIIAIVAAVLLFKPDIFERFKSENNETIIQNQTVVPSKDFVGKPIKDDVAFNCRFDSDCSFFNNDCDNTCRCDSVRGDCFIQG